MIQILTIQGKSRKNLRIWVQFFELYCSTEIILVLLVTFINEFNVVLSFQNLKKFNIVYIV